MNIADMYTQYVREKTENGDGWKSAFLGFRLFNIKNHIAPDKTIARGYRELETMMMEYMCSALSSPFAFSSIFFPHEILMAAGINAVSTEAISCFLSHGYGLEKYLIDQSESEGIASTLCSYHKAFIAAVSELTPMPELLASTSIACDGNLCAFRYLSEKKELPFHYIDVPYSDDEASISYLAAILEKFAHSLASFDENKLKEILRIENETREELLEYYRLTSMKKYPGKLIDQMYFIMATHSLLGKREFLTWIRKVNKELLKGEDFTGNNILWVHVIPFYSEPLKELLNTNDRYQVIASDMLFDSFEELDADRPYEALARKLIHHVFNGSYDKKIAHIDRLLSIHRTDGIIAFSQWGCKQASGGLSILKKHYKDADMPLLILDGDALDKRNSQDGQMKTRCEAFLELLEAR